MDNSQAAEQYCIVMVSPKFFSSRVDIMVDYGKETNAANPQLQFETEDMKNATNLVDALNYMAKKGWHMVNGYSVSNAKTGNNEQHYLMKKAAR